MITYESGRVIYTTNQITNKLNVKAMFTDTRNFCYYIIMGLEGIVRGVSFSSTNMPPSFVYLSSLFSPGVK